MAELLPAFRHIVVLGNLALVPAVTTVLCIFPVSPPVALVLGLFIALTVGTPWQAHLAGWTHRTLAWSVVGLGAGMNLAVVGRVGLHGLVSTVASILGALSLGHVLGRRLGVKRNVALLIGVGTAICGGSAIAAVAPTIKAKQEDISVALATVFVLNSVALLVFPALGHHLHLSQEDFGLWCALAIHDTSSVVGAASEYGQRALEIATTTKLARAFWVVPLTLGIAFGRARLAKGSERATAQPKLPWFIGGFVIVAALVTYVPALVAPGHTIALFARRLLNVTLFLVGLGLSRDALKTLGVRPLVQGVLVWLGLGFGTLGALLLGWLNA
jgi:uncharacterized integral membrane protein (TIGR00698 family)